MDAMLIALVLWTIAGMFGFMILKVDLGTMKQYPVISSLILIYLGPVGWLVFVVRVGQMLWYRRGRE